MDSRVYLQSLSILSSTEEENVFLLNEKQRVAFEVDRFPAGSACLMTPQNKLLCQCMLHTLEASPKMPADFFKSAGIFVGNGGIYPPQKMIRTLIQYSGTGNVIDYTCLFKNIGRLSPLEGVRSLPTASNFFLAKMFDVHGVGNPLFVGDDSGFVGLLRAQEAIQAERLRGALVACAEHQEPHLQRIFSPNNEFVYPQKNGAAAALLTNNNVDALCELLSGQDEWLLKKISHSDLKMRILNHLKKTFELNQERLRTITHVLLNCKSKVLEKFCLGVLKAFFEDSVCLQSFNEKLHYRGAVSSLSNLYMAMQHKLKNGDQALLLSVTPGGLLASIIIENIKRGEK